MADTTVLRTPDERFSGLPGFGFEPHFAEVPLDATGEGIGTAGDSLRLCYLDEGPADGEVVLLLHGEPSWSFLYRTMIPILVDAGLRCVVPDLVGFGRSDKLGAQQDYTFARHVAWMRALVLDCLTLDEITLVGQDWGSLIGLRLLAENPGRFARAVIANGGLPTGDHPMPPAFLAWQRFARESPDFRIGSIVAAGCASPLPPEIVAAYDAPFPDDRYLAGARAFPSLVPTAPDDPAAPANRRAWQELAKFDRPFLTAFSDGDPITRSGDALLQSMIPGAAGQPHVTIAGGGHFLQEDRGPELARVVADFVATTRLDSAD